MKRALSLLLPLLGLSVVASAQFQFTAPQVLTQGFVGTSYSYVMQTVNGVGNLTACNANVPPGLTIAVSGTSCVISGIPSTVGTYNFATFGFDSSTPPQQTASHPTQITITSGGSQFLITTTTIPDAVVGQAYSAAIQTVNSAGNITVCQVGGSLPSGLFINPSGTTCVISGTPSQTTSPITFLLQARDSQGNFTPTKPLQIGVAATGGSGNLQITTTAVTAGSVGNPYSFQFTSNAIGTPQWSQTTVTTTTLPPGLTLSTGGILSGTPTQAGTYQFTIQVFDPYQEATATGSFTMVISSGVLSIVQFTIPNGFQGAAYSTTITATGGAPPYTYSLGPTQVQGLQIDSLSGVISGTPTNSGNFNLQVTVRDAAQNAVTRVFTLFVATQLSILTTTLPNGAPGVPYTPQVLQAGGGQSPYFWNISSGALPPGLTLERTTGLISGTPTANGTFTFTVQLLDSGQRTASKALSITIGEPVQITTTSLSDGAVGALYSASLTATGGQAPYTWTFSGTLPAGLTLASNGVIGGTPTAVGSSTITVTVTDSQRSTASKTFTINVVSPLSISTNSVIDGVRGQAYSQAFGASGGTPPYTWSIALGALPDGLTLNSSNALLSGTPTTAGSFGFTLQVKDVLNQTATRSYVINVSESLSITSGNLTGTFNQAFAGNLAATGGFSPYSWSVASGQLPAGLSLNPTTGALTGTPTLPGAQTVSFRVTDARQQSATKSIVITINLPQVPPVNVTITNTGGGAVGPNQQPLVALALGSAFPSEVSGVLTLTFTPLSGGDDPNVRFNNGLRTLNFIVRQGSTQAIFPSVASGAVLTGTVAGTITLTARMSAADVDITPAPAPTQRITIDAAPPVITSVQLQQSSGGVNVVVTGYTTTREVTSGLFRFAGASGSTLQTTDFTVPLTAAFASWFSSTASNATGGQFTLTVPFSVAGGSSTSLVAVTVTLTNSRGNSAAVSP